MAGTGEKRNILIGVAGGTGSGKTTVTRALTTRFGREAVRVVEQDHYYKPHDHLPMEQRARINYDHPGAFDSDLLVAQVQQLLANEPIERPVYDFVSHARGQETVTVPPAPVIIVEGILVLENTALRDLMDVRIYVDTDADVRVLRRLQRDIKDRGRTLECVVHQYLQTVRPMHLQFVEPSKRHADVIIPEGGRNRVALDMLAAKIEYLLRRHEAALATS